MLSATKLHNNPDSSPGFTSFNTGDTKPEGLGRTQASIQRMNPLPVVLSGLRPYSDAAYPKIPLSFDWMFMVNKI